MLEGEPEEQQEDNGKEGEEDEEEDELPVAIPTLPVAMDHFEKFRYYVESLDNVPQDVMQSLLNLDNFMLKTNCQKKKQSTLDKYFNKK